MIHIDIVNELDRGANSYQKSQADRTIYELDSCLWDLVRLLALEKPTIAKNAFSLSESCVVAISRLDDRQIALLASGNILSFRLLTDEIKIIELLSYDNYVNTTSLASSSNGFDSYYWSAVSKISSTDIQLASISFGISLDLCKAVSNASPSQINLIVQQLPLAFELRIKPHILNEFTKSTSHNGTKNDLPHVLFKKIQQAISVK